MMMTKMMLMKKIVFMTNNGDDDNDDDHYDNKEDGYDGNPNAHLQLVWSLLDSVPLHMQPVRGTKLLVDRMRLANSGHKMRISS